ncbi:MAG: hypothetical protein ABII12_00230 [Planctomycetota bacterium]
MKTTLEKWTLTIAAACLPVLIAGCDDDIGSDEIIDIIYASGDVLGWILHLVL